MKQQNQRVKIKQKQRKESYALNRIPRKEFIRGRKTQYRLKKEGM